MKKMLTVFSIVACMMLFSGIPAFAHNMARDNDTPGEDVRQGINRGINATNRALGTDFDRVNGTNGNGMNGNGFDRNGVNGYRTNATNADTVRNNVRTYATTDNDRGFDWGNWGWLGLAGLIGLAGMRGRDRDRA